MEDADIRQVGDEEDEEWNDRDNEDGKDDDEHEVEENSLSVKKYSFKNWPKHMFLRGKIAVFGGIFGFSSDKRDADILIEKRATPSGAFHHLYRTINTSHHSVVVI